MMSKLPKVLETANLPQYQLSATFMERFLDAIHEEGKEIERAPNTRGIKLVDDTELNADYLDYFFENKRSMEKEFLHELREKLGNAKADLFCEIVSQDWYDGKGLRNGTRVLSLKLSVRDYLRAIVGDDLPNIVENHELSDSRPCLDKKEIAAILTMNDQMMVRHIEEWKKGHPNSDQMSDDNIFFRRGLSLKKPLDTNVYREWSYINSYSIALSAPEKFSQMQAGFVCALVCGDLHLFDGRILFFSPFVPNMDVGQLEAGVIPADRPMPIKLQGKHAGILEYILDRPEELS
jgi:hypothetical protein